MQYNIHHMTAPDPQGAGAARAVRQALRDAAIDPDAVDFINAHGTGTPLNDALEAGVLAETFAGNERAPVLTAIKSKLGHSGGASGVFSVVTACLILKSGQVPPTANHETRDEALESFK